MDPNLVVMLAFLGGMVVGAGIAFAGVWIGSRRNR